MNLKVYAPDVLNKNQVLYFLEYAGYGAGYEGSPSEEDEDKNIVEEEDEEDEDDGDDDEADELE